MKLGRFVLLGGIVILVILWNLYQSRMPSPAPEESATVAAPAAPAQTATDAPKVTSRHTPTAAPSGPERYTDMAVTITINPDATIVVSEAITAVVLGEEIRHGITRDIPLVRHHRWFNSVSDIDVLSATINGHDASYTTSISQNTANIRIGDADAILKPGVYTFGLKYELDRQIGHFKQFDELYWNVIGTGFAFDTEKASAVVHLPKGAPVRQMAAYTGTPDESSKHGAVFSKGAEDTVRFETTRPIFAGEAFTIAVSWPLGFVTDPGRWERLIGNPTPILISVATLLGTSLYFVLVWWQVGREPQRGPLVPVYAPTLPPHAMRFLEQVGYDTTCLVVAIMNICAKGHARLADDLEDAETVRLLPTDASNTAFRKPLSAGEHAVFDVLLASRAEGVALSKANRTLIDKASNALKESMEERFTRGYFETNGGLFVIGAVIILFGLFASTAWEQGGPSVDGLANAGAFAFGAAGVLATLFVVIAFVVRRATGRRDRSWFDRVLSRAARWAAPFALFAVIATGPTYLNSVGLLPFLLMLLAIVVLFVALRALPRRTALGQNTMDEVRGTRAYISVAEADRLKFDNPPDRTPEHFSDLLPYATALGVETAWTNQFIGAVGAAAVAAPTWYSGRNWSSDGWSSRHNPVANGVSSAVAAQRQAISGRSGSGGGGFAGGGGGGGGSGGW